jgi:hypothetical protein
MIKRSASLYNSPAIVAVMTEGTMTETLPCLGSPTMVMHASPSTMWLCASSKRRLDETGQMLLADHPPALKTQWPSSRFASRCAVTNSPQTPDIARV